MTPFNFFTMTEYSGKNAMTLSGPDFPAYATFNQVRELGGSVKKGSHGAFVFCGYREKLDKKTGETIRVPKGAIAFLIKDCDLPEDLLAEITASKPLPSFQSVQEQIMIAVV